MRTTITLDHEAEALVKKAMADRKLSFEDVVNEAVVRGLLVDRERYEFRTQPRKMGDTPREPGQGSSPVSSRTRRS